MTRLMGLAGWSGAGKTTLLAALIPHLRQLGVRVSTIKHAHHAFDVDTPGKDSWVHRQAGACEVLVASARRFALMHEVRDSSEPTLYDLLKKLSPVDLVLIEGFKQDRHPKIEIYREANGKPLLHPHDRHIHAIVTDSTATFQVPRFNLDDIAAIACWIIENAQPLTDFFAEGGS